MVITQKNDSRSSENRFSAPVAQKHVKALVLSLFKGAAVPFPLLVKHLKHTKNTTKQQMKRSIINTTATDL